MSIISKIADDALDQIRTHQERTARNPQVIVVTKTRWDAFTRPVTEADYQVVRNVLGHDSGAPMLFGVPVMVIDVPNAP